jgi:hypothetical protein
VHNDEDHKGDTNANSNDKTQRRCLGASNRTHYKPFTPHLQRGAPNKQQATHPPIEQKQEKGLVVIKSHSVCHPDSKGKVWVSET